MTSDSDEVCPSCGRLYSEQPPWECDEAAHAIHLPASRSQDAVPAPAGTFDDLTDVELDALDVVMAAQGFHRVAGHLCKRGDDCPGRKGIQEKGTE